MEGDLEVARLAVNFFNLGQGMDLDIGVPADLDQLGGNYSHGAIIGGEGLVDLGHFAADGRAFFHQMDVVTGVGQVQGGLYPGNAAPHYYHRPQDIFRHGTLPL
jgi:hypothetical protein